MKLYRLITRHQWLALLRKQEQLQQQKEQRAKQQQRRPLLLPTDYFTGEAEPLPRWFSEFKPVKFRYSSAINEVVAYCVKQPDLCHELYPTLEKLGLYQGRNTYNNDDVRVIPALKEAITSERAILLEKEVDIGSGMLPPTKSVLARVNHQTSRKLTPDEVRQQQQERLRFYAYDEENWIELSVNEAPNQPFTLFDHSSQKRLYQGTLDSKGHAYIKLPLGVKWVDIVFDKQNECREWYYDMPLQLVGGVCDAAQNILDLAQWLPSSPLFLKHVYQAIINGETVTNPLQLPQVALPETTAGALTHGVTQFLIGFIPAYRATKFIKPLQQMGSWSRGMIAGGVADFSVFAPHEQRLSNLVESFPELSNPITEYLQAKPEDGAAEGRFKNALEGLLLGALAEPFVQSLRLLKYARIKWSAIGVKTRQRYQLEAEYPEGIHFDINLQKHITTLDGFSQKSGISGSHNADEFYAVAETYGIKIESEIPSSVNGIKTVQYRIPAKHPQTGEFTHYKGNGAKPFEKTIYDPQIFSDQKMLDLGQDAAAIGYKDAMSSLSGTADVTIEGIEFRVYVDKSTGIVRNVHPQ